jgi:hypothetical protein
VARAEPLAALERVSFLREGPADRRALPPGAGDDGSAVAAAAGASPLRSPSALFSVLQPKTRIPPHTGVANFRLVVHLPLIVPPGCGFRVGGETRQWRLGEAWVFDDTIEHEAWNDSEQTRIIFICDVWSPRLSPDERAVIGEIIAATDAFNGTQPTSSV